ncbi:MAG: hypothetical protein ACYCSS_14785 [Sulfuriferula sp.]
MQCIFRHNFLFLATSMIFSSAAAGTFSREEDRRWITWLLRAVSAKNMEE